MVASIGKGTVAQYYLKRAEYYMGGAEPAGVWLSSSSALGIMAATTVDPDLFEKLHEGLDRAGKPLLTNAGDRANRVSGYDLTLSAPKSVSILYALADPATRAAIAEVQLEASRAVVATLNREAAFTRRGKNGVVIEKASLIVAAFQHSEARPAPHLDGRTFSDMDLHTHLCIANLAERPRHHPSDEPSYGALDGRALYAAKMLGGSVYHLTLSQGLQRLGFNVEVTGSNGIFSLVDPAGRPAFDEDVTSFFSARRNQIEKRLADYDLLTGEAQQLAAAVGRATRLSKTDTEQDRFELWADCATELGVSVPALADRLRDATRGPMRVSETMITQRLAEIPRDLTEQESVFERRTLLAAVASALVGTGAGPERIETEMERITTSQQVVQLSSDIYGHGLYSTPEVIAIERNLLALAQKQSKRRWASVDSAYITAESVRRGLSEEQREAVLAATDHQALTVISGAAGSGKTTALKLVVDGYRDKTVLASATAWRTAKMLHEELGVPAFAIDSLLARIKAGQELLDHNTVLLIDECGQIGSRSMHALLSAAQRAKAKIVLVGDAEQLQPIAAGPALKILTTVIEPSRIDRIIRQRDQWARDAARCFAKGDATTALAHYAERGLLQIGTGARDTVTAAVNQYFANKGAAPDREHLLIAKSNKVVRALNTEIRRRLRADKMLTGPEYTIQASDSSGRAFTLALAVGDRIRFGVRQDAIGDGVINGTVGRILEIDAAGKDHLTITAEIDNRRVTFATADLTDSAGRIRLGHNLAVTAYSSQGLTAETATVVLDTGFDRHDSYVAMSRSRGTTTIFYDADLVAAKLKATKELGAPSSDTTEAERLALLAASISRANLKTSTLAFDHTMSQSRQRESRDIGDRVR